jgi:hypothetical protein
VPPQVLFSKYDVYNVIESQKKRVKEAYLRLPDEEAMDEDAIRRIKAEYMLDVPVLKSDEMYCVESKTKIDVSRNPNRVFFPGTGPVMEDATELTVHIPFEGDPGVFNITPSAYNSRIAQGEVVGKELLLRVVVSDGKYDVQGHIDREVTQINWALTQLREKNAYESQELEGALRQAVATRKRSIESRGNVIGNLRIPLRSSVPSQTPASPAVPHKTVPKPAVSAVPNKSHRWDVFISHASEDKPYVEPLAKALEAGGVNVWYDRTSIGWGDDIRTSIDNGLLNCDYGVVVFSKAFLGKKKWTEYEVSALFGLETVDRKRILPIWHEVTYEDVLKYSPALAQRRAKSSADDSNDDIVNSVLSMLGRPQIATQPQATSASAAVVWPGGKKSVAIAYALYETTGPGAKSVALYVRRSPKGQDRFTFEDAAGEEHEGTRKDIAIKYALADKTLTMSGYQRRNVSGGGEYPEFNL